MRSVFRFHVVVAGIWCRSPQLDQPSLGPGRGVLLRWSPGHLAFIQGSASFILPLSL